MRRNPEDVALLLAVIFLRSGEKRARVSEKTLKLLGYRERLKAAFVVAVSDALLDYYDLCLIQIDGGFGIIPTKSLEAAKSITAKKFLEEEELDSIRRGEEIDTKSLLDELGFDDSVGDSD